MLTHRPQFALSGTALISHSNARRRRALPQRTLSSPIAWRAQSSNEPAQGVLENTLRSACEVIGAQHGFVLLLRDETALEVSCAHQIKPRELLDAVLGCAGRALHRALSENAPGMCSGSGMAHAEMSDSADSTAPAVIALPLELGSRHRGALCLIQTGTPRQLSELDLEILSALSEQAALALQAANQQSALSRLAASLNGLSPRLA